MNDDYHQNLTFSFCFTGQFPVYVAAVVNPSEDTDPTSVRTGSVDLFAFCPRTPMGYHHPPPHP